MIDRRGLLAGAGASLFGSRTIARALAIDADVRRGSLMDVQHIVILMQENRSFDHYFGSLAGVRGFGDRFPIPSAEGSERQTIWTQQRPSAAPRLIAPFHLDTRDTFALMRADGTPHTWPDAQAAWDEGRMSHWPEAKTQRSMGHYTRDDLPFQFALAEAFTICDAYHCSIQTGTNTNRLFLWTGTNDPEARYGGPAIGNSHDRLVKDGGHPEGYRWTTYVERLQAAGIDWRIYEDMADNFTDNPLAGFKRFRDAHAVGPSHPDHELIARGMSTRKLDRLRGDVMAGTLPQVSYIVADAASSEHPAASSPAQGADYTARVIDALTSNAEVWGRTALLVMFDENDGFFDHMPPPAPPSRDRTGRWAGASTVSTEGEYHLVPSTGDKDLERPDLIGRPYGLGPRVPMYVVSPWSRGGWVNSQVFDHTSVIRLLEQRFGVPEPNISPWRRAVCGDLTSTFDFSGRRDSRNPRPLPPTDALARRAAALPGRTPAAPPTEMTMPTQAFGTRRSRALPYALDVAASVTTSGIELAFLNTGQAAAVLHIYDRLHREQAPRRYTVGVGESLNDTWTAPAAAQYDLWVLGPNGFHRHFAGRLDDEQVRVAMRADPMRQALVLTVSNPGIEPRDLTIRPMAYSDEFSARHLRLAPGQSKAARWSLAKTSGWYDLAVYAVSEDRFLCRLARRVETGRDAISDPALGGPALASHPV